MNISHSAQFVERVKKVSGWRREQYAARLQQATTAIFPSGVRQ